MYILMIKLMIDTTSVQNMKKVSHVMTMCITSPYTEYRGRKKDFAFPE